jgi:hypothetical protein
MRPAGAGTPGGQRTLLLRCDVGATRPVSRERRSSSASWDKMDSMSSGGDGGASESDAPRSHRRPGPSVVRFPTEPRFWKTVRDSPREPACVGLVIFAALFFGSRAITSGDSVLYRALGIASTFAGLLLLASYVLRFHQAVLDNERWSTSRSRRVLRALLKYSHGIFESIALLALLGWALIWLAGRL